MRWESSTGALPGATPAGNAERVESVCSASCAPLKNRSWLPSEFSRGNGPAIDAVDVSPDEDSVEPRVARDECLVESLLIGCHGCQYRFSGGRSLAISGHRYSANMDGRKWLASGPNPADPAPPARGEVMNNPVTRKLYSRQSVSPVGTLKLVASERGLAAILWEDDDPRRVRLNDVVEKIDHPVLLETERQLREYFARERRAFNLTLDFAGTDFQRQVWAALLTIPFGETRTYGQIAQQIGAPLRPCALWAPPMAQIPYPSLLPATGSSARRGSSPALPADSRSRPICWRSNRRRLSC